MVIVFHTKPSIRAWAATVGPLEGSSVFRSYFDAVSDDEKFQEKSNEKGQQRLITDTCKALMEKAKLDNLDIDYFLSGDLINQMTPTNFAARELALSFIGMFSACATSISSVVIAGLLTELGASKNAIAGASSQHNATERQFRYPVYYGGQKPATAQWTVTGAGYALVCEQRADYPYMAAATIGKVMDYGQTDPFDMGSAMAPAAYDTIKRHLQQRKQKITDYDLVMTGDLGKIGLKLVKAMLAKDGMKNEELQRIRDAGAEFYGDDDSFQAGASGAGCSATVYYSYVLSQFMTGRYKRVLLVATGALLSPLTYQQGETIPCTAHALEIAMN